MGPLAHSNSTDLSSMPNKQYQAITRKLDEIFGKELFFLCGVLKSGTTWLERTLDSHPQVVCKGEAHFGSDLSRLMGEAINEYNKAMPTKGGAIAHLKEYGGHTEVLAYDASDLDYLIITAIGLMLIKWSDNGDIKCIGEKTPDNLNAMPILGRLFPHAKFIHIVRDGRDVAVSAWNFNMNTDIGRTIKEWGSFKNFVPQFGASWADQVMRGREVGRTLGTAYREVRYEDLIRESLQETKGIFEFLNVDTSENTIRACVDASSFQTMSGGREPGDEDGESFFRKGIAGDWTNHFDDELVESFSNAAGETLKEFGYV